jgi:quercetin dioxygenase-like cupin family protein
MSGELVAVDANAVSWRENPIEHIGRSFQIKRLFNDPDTGMGVVLLRYPAGLINPLHSHPCGHGMYVLEGTLVTHRGTFGPGNFVWFPEGEQMEHGATAEEDVVALFIYNKPFRIDYVGVQKSAAK